MKQLCLSKILLFSLAFQISSCSTTQEFEGNSQAIEGPVFYTVQQDDRLSDIAYALTGSADDWAVIAKHNQVADARKIRAGDVLEIPIALVRKRSNRPADGGFLALNTIGSAENQPTRLKTPPESRTTGSRLKPSSVSTDETTLAEHKADVVLSPVNINRQFQMSSIDVDINADANATALNVKIIVSGTYYPKGIYEQASESATLITRVAPGTTFDLEAEYDGWYRIKFENEAAFLRAIDGKIFFPDKPKILRSVEAIN